MQGLDNIVDVLLPDVPANAEIHFQQLVSLVQLALDDVSVDSFDDEVFQFPEIPHLQVSQQHGVGDTLQTGHMMFTKPLANIKEMQVLPT